MNKRQRRKRMKQQGLNPNDKTYPHWDDPYAHSHPCQPPEGWTEATEAEANAPPPMGIVPPYGVTWRMGGNTLHGRTPATWGISGELLRSMAPEHKRAALEFLAAPTPRDDYMARRMQSGRPLEDLSGTVHTVATQDDLARRMWVIDDVGSAPDQDAIEAWYRDLKGETP